MAETAEEGFSAPGPSYIMGADILQLEAIPPRLVPPSCFKSLKCDVFYSF